MLCPDLIGAFLGSPEGEPDKRLAVHRHSVAGGYRQRGTMKAKSVTEALASELSYNSENKRAYIKVAKRTLRRLAKAMGLAKGTYKVEVNEGGMAVGGDVFLFTEGLHVQICGSRFMPGHDVLYRTRTGWKDYTGGPNHWAASESLDDPEQFAMSLKQFLRGDTERFRVSRSARVC